MPAAPEIQQIPARHGTATFVPKGHVIKIINTYGRQVVGTWAFALPTPPTEQGVEETEGEEAEKAGEVDEVQTAEEVPQDAQAQSGAEKAGGGEGEAKVRAGSETEPKPELDQAADATDAAGGGAANDVKKPGWIPYIASMATSRRKPAAAGTRPTSKTATAKETAERKDGNEKRTWASYLPSGRGYSNYVPAGVGVPTGKTLAAFAHSHHRDPTKSYAEQLYDFSKTPVGAGAISAASGGSYASSAYAAYKAYAASAAAQRVAPPTEYLSMPHTRASTRHLVPRVADTLVSNLRRPLLTLLEDTAATHDSLTAACDPALYRALGVARWQHHGSCAQNVVLALRELNASARLELGAHVAVDAVPAPLNLFMNATWRGDEGVIELARPRGRKGEFVRLRAERDVVVVMSACPMDVEPVNGAKCMAAHFVVQQPAATTAPDTKAAAETTTPAPRTQASGARKAPRLREERHPAKAPDEPTPAPPPKPAAKTRTSDASPVPPAASPAKPSPPPPPPKANRPKPRKLERRTPSLRAAGTATATATSS